MWDFLRYVLEQHPEFFARVLVTLMLTFFASCATVYGVARLIKQTLDGPWKIHLGGRTASGEEGEEERADDEDEDEEQR